MFACTPGKAGYTYPWMSINTEGGGGDVRRMKDIYIYGHQPLIRPVITILQTCANKKLNIPAPRASLKYFFNKNACYKVASCLLTSHHNFLGSPGVERVLPVVV